jgi:hypothetical protein
MQLSNASPPAFGFTFCGPLVRVLTLKRRGSQKPARLEIGRVFLRGAR